MSRNIELEIMPYGSRYQVRVLGGDLGINGQVIWLESPGLEPALVDQLRRGCAKQEEVDQAKNEISRWLGQPLGLLIREKLNGSTEKDPLRLIYRIEDPERRSILGELPIEMLTLSDPDTVLALDERVAAIVQQVYKPPTGPNLKAQPPLRVLLIRSNPRDLGGKVPAVIPVRDELRKSPRSNLVELDILTREPANGASGTPCFEEFEKRVGGNSYQLIIFLGHGDLLNQEGNSAAEAVLQFEEKDSPYSRPVTASQLKVLLQRKPVPVVLLVGCLTAADGPEGGDGNLDKVPQWMRGGQGVAQVLVNSDSTVQMAVGMRYRIEAADGELFLKAFFQSLLDDRPGHIEGAIGAARRAMKLQGRSPLAWSSPVLFSNMPREPLFPFLAGQKETSLAPSDGPVPRPSLVPRHGRHSPEALPKPSDPEDFVGRDGELKLLRRAWDENSVHIVEFIADGGVGKSRLVWEWMQELKRGGYAGCPQTMEWSFYSQGHHVQQTDSNRFLERALKHFEHPDCPVSNRSPQDAEEKGEAIADAFLWWGGVLVLDGVEPLQNPSDVEGGALRDDGLKALLEKLYKVVSPLPADPKWLVIITTRWRLPELKGPADQGIVSKFVEKLSDAEGARLLRRVKLPNQPDKFLYFNPTSPLPPDKVAAEVGKEFEKASAENDGHALSLHLLATQLLRSYDGDLSQRTLVYSRGNAGMDIYPEPEYRHAHRLMNSYDNLFANENSPISIACRQVLYLIGLFDRPASREFLRVLRDDPNIELTKALTDADFNDAVSELRGLRLLGGDPENDNAIEAHPLVREHFGRSLIAQRPAAWAESHSVLFEYLKKRVDDPFGTADDIDLLIQAVAHGCKAGRHRETFHDVFLARIVGKDPQRAIGLLGSAVPLLSALSYFFEGAKWGHPIASTGKDASGPGLPMVDQLGVLQVSGGYLTTVRGYGSPDVEQSYAEALVLARQLGDRKKLAAVLYGYFRFHVVRARLEQALKDAEEVEKLARDEADPVLTLAGYRALSTTNFYRGDHRAAVSQGDAGSELYPKVRDQEIDFVSTEELGVTCLCYSALSRWHLGQWPEALRQSEQAIDLARKGDDRHALAVALAQDNLLRQLHGDPERIAKQAEELYEVSSAGRFSLWRAVGLCDRAMAQGMEGKIDEGIDQLQRALAVLEETGARLRVPTWKSSLAEMLSKAGEMERASKVLSDALGQAKSSGEGYWEPELRRLQALLRLNQGTNLLQVERELRNAWELGEKQGSIALSLRSAISRGRLWLSVINPPPQSSRSPVTRDQLVELIASARQDLRGTIEKFPSEVLAAAKVANLASPGELAAGRAAAELELSGGMMLLDQLDHALTESGGPLAKDPAPVGSGTEAERV